MVSQRKKDRLLHARLLKIINSQRFPPECLVCPKRTRELAASKTNKQAKESTFERSLKWGTQQMINPVSKAAKKAQASERIKELAKPKKNFQLGTDRVNRPLYVYSIGRPSQIWEISSNALKAKISERLKQLALPRQRAEKNLVISFDNQHSLGRPSAIWVVSEGAKHYVASARMEELAKPKVAHPDFMPNREKISVVSSQAMEYVASERSLRLAEPKKRVQGPFFEFGDFDEVIWKVKKSAKVYAPSENLNRLAQPKLPHPKFVPNREYPFPISTAAKKARPTNRSDHLSKPVRRLTMDHVQFNPDAFLVKTNALKGSCSARIDVLSQPVER